MLNETPPDKLEAALAPLLDIDGALKFLALDIALVNSDGYWTRASDYSIYQDVKGRFHVIPHDMNEALIDEGGRGRGPGGPPPDSAAAALPAVRWSSAWRWRPACRSPRRTWAGGGGRGFGPGGGGPDLDPLIGLTTRASRSLEAAGGAGAARAVSRLRARHRRALARLEEARTRWLTGYQALIADEVKLDTRKLYSTEAFETGLEGGDDSLAEFVEQRREFLSKSHSSRSAASEVAYRLQAGP